MTASTSRTVCFITNKMTKETAAARAMGVSLCMLLAGGCGYLKVERLSPDGSVDTRGDSDSENNEDTGVAGDTDSLSPTNTDADTATDSDSTPSRSTGADTQTGASIDEDTGMGRDTGTVADTGTESGTQTDTATVADRDTSSGSGDTAVDSDTSGASDSDRETGTATDLSTEPSTETESDTVSEADTANEADTVTDGDSAPDTDTGFDSATDTDAPAVPDLTRGYWRLDAVDGNAVSWNDSTLLLTNSVTNPDSTISMDARFDWFEEQVPKDTNFGTATYIPDTSRLQVTADTGGTLFDYQATYEESTDSLVIGSWEPEAGVFTAFRQFDGFRLQVSDVQATSQHSPVYGAMMIVDETHTHYWSARRGSLTGQTISFVLTAPSTLSAVRLLSYRLDTSYSPPTAVSVRCYDTRDQLVATIPLAFAESPVYQGRELVVTEPVARLEMDILDVVNPTGDWLIIHEMDLFGGL